MQEKKISRMTQEPAQRIDPAADVGTVTLKTANLANMLQFYTDVIGLKVIAQENGRATLGAGRPILKLEEVAGAQIPEVGRRPFTGLYHSAILFPNRRTLAIKVAQLAGRRVPIGQADHLVSEAFYLSDPEGNGLELYRDRARSEWTWVNGQIQMASDPIDWQSFLDEIQGDGHSLDKPSVPEETRLGHIHLKVADIPEAEKFYHGLLGFDITASWPGALFLSAGGYHHHLGMNTWESRGAKPPAEPATGLKEFSIMLPNEAELDRLARQVEQAGLSVERNARSALLLDPSENRLRLIV
jgi:catechol 2,3-dioxygenase